MHDSKPFWFKFLGKSRILQDFECFCWNSNQNSQNFRKIRGIPVRLTEHLLKDFQCRPWGCVDIFWNSQFYFRDFNQSKIWTYASIKWLHKNNANKAAHCSNTKGMKGNNREPSQLRRELCFQTTLHCFYRFILDSIWKETFAAILFKQHLEDGKAWSVHIYYTSFEVLNRVWKNEA